MSMPNGAPAPAHASAAAIAAGTAQPQPPAPTAQGVQPHAGYNAGGGGLPAAAPAAPTAAPAQPWAPTTTAPAPPGGAPEPEPGKEPNWLTKRLEAERGKATAAVAAQLGVSVDDAKKVLEAHTAAEEAKKSEAQRRDEKLTALAVEAQQAQELGNQIVSYAASALGQLNPQQQAFVKQTCGDVSADGLGAQAKVAIAQQQLTMVQAFQANPGVLGAAPAAPAAQPGQPAPGTPPAAPQQIPAPTSTTAAPATTAATPPAQNSPDWHYAQFEQLPDLAKPGYYKRNKAAIESSAGWRQRYE